MTWTERILEFPVRTAAVDEFLRELKAKGSGDLNAVLTTLNESGENWSTRSLGPRPKRALAT